MPLNTRVKYILAITIFNLLTYFSIQQVASASAIDLLTSADEGIPLIPDFIWIYNSLIPVLAISSILLIRTKKIFFAACWAFLIATVVLDIFYILLPSFYPREVFEISNLSTWFLSLTREIDGSNNTFPSGHVTLAWLLFWSVIHSKWMATRPVIKILYGLWAVTISISTLTLKQHYIVDVVSGFVLAYGCWVGGVWLVEKFQKQKSLRKTEALIPEPETQLAE